MESSKKRFKVRPLQVGGKFDLGLVQAMNGKNASDYEFNRQTHTHEGKDP